MSDAQQEKNYCFDKFIEIVCWRLKGTEGLYAKFETRNRNQPDDSLDLQPMLYDLRGLDEHIAGLENLSVFHPSYADDLFEGRKARDALVSTYEMLDRNEIKITDIEVFKLDQQPLADGVDILSDDLASKSARVSAFWSAVYRGLPKNAR